MSTVINEQVLQSSCHIHSQWVTIKLPKMNLTDSNMQETVLPFLCQILQRSADRAGDVKELWGSIDLAENPLSNSTTTSLLEILKKYHVRLKTLKLYKCQLTDDAGIALANFVAEQREPIQEMHLSHNRLTIISFVALLCAVSKHGGYPHGPQKTLPLWVRVEYNQISRPAETLKMVETQVGLRSCLASDRDSCGPWRCVQTKNVPMVHLFAVAMQKPPLKNEDPAGVMKLIARFSGREVVKPVEPVKPVAKPVVPPVTTTQGPAANRLKNSAWAWGSPNTEKDTNENKPPTPNIEVLDEPKEKPKEAVEVEKDKEKDKRKICSVADLDVGLLRTKLNGSLLSLQCFSCEQYISSDGSSIKIVLAMNCCHTFCSECFADTVRRNVNSADIKCGSKQVPCPHCDTQMTRSEAVVLEETDWHVLSQKALSLNGIAEPRGKPETETAVAKKEGGSKLQVLKEQIETSDPLCINSFECHFCKTISLEPLLTTCSHLFCKVCFQGWVESEVKDYKLKNPTAQTVSSVPCPYPDCGKPLRKQDVGALNSDEIGNKMDAAGAGAFTVIRRMRNNLQVRCVNHRDHFDLPFGQQAKKLANSVQCAWIGDLNEYAAHFSKCEVEIALNLQTSGAIVPVAPKKKKEIRKALYAFAAEGNGQLTLNVGDLVEMIEVSDAGWAAGRRVDTVGNVLSDAGWFPMTFLAYVPVG